MYCLITNQSFLQKYILVIEYIHFFKLFINHTFESVTSYFLIWYNGTRIIFLTTFSLMFNIVAEWEITEDLNRP